MKKVEEINANSTGLKKVKEGQSRSKNLKLDEKVHCDQCDTKYKAKQELNMHKTVYHADSSAYECDNCQ